MSIHTKLAIIGSGPAGYTAALYTARAKIDPIVFSGKEAGGQLMYTTLMENFPGFPEGIMGPKLMANMKAQAEKFGTKVVFETVTKLDLTDRPFKIWINNSTQEADYFADAIIIATGATAVMLEVENEKRLLGRGVSTCAVCDAAFFVKKKVFVVGGGDSAMEDALALAKYSDQVTILHRKDQFRASKIMQERVLNNSNITVRWNSQVKAISGKDKLESIEIETDGEKKVLEADGLFLAIGRRPQTELFKEHLQLTKQGYLVTAQSPTAEGINLANTYLHKYHSISFPTMTSIEGVFAAGDVVDLRYRQAIVASGSGAAAALDVESWLLEKDS